MAFHPNIRFLKLVCFFLLFLSKYLKNKKHTFLKGDTLFVSKIFKWFSEDFNDDAFGFFRKYATKDLKKELEAKSDRISVKYLHYDWSLNGM